MKKITIAATGVWQQIPSRDLSIIFTLLSSADLSIAYERSPSSDKIVTLRAGTWYSIQFDEKSREQNLYVKWTIWDTLDILYDVKDVWNTSSDGSNISDKIASMLLANVDDTSTTDVTYIWYFTPWKDDWIIKQFDCTWLLAVTYANVSNNPTKTTYALAWASVTSLTYDLDIEI